MLFHGAVIKIGNGKEYHHYDGEQGIEVIGNGADEKLHSVLCACTAGKSGNGRRPGRNGGDYTDRRGGGIDEIGKLCAGDVMLIGNRAHNRADGQAVEIVVDENQHAEKNRAELSTHTGLDVLGGPTAESHRFC